MSLPPIAADSCAVVVVGDLRPVEIGPDWLRSEEIVDPSLSDEKYEVLIPREACNFTLGAIKYQIGARGLQVETTDQSEFEPMRDLVVDVLTAMPKRPIAQLGINRVVHFNAPDDDQWHSVGDRLVNNSLWDGVLNIVGMRAVTYWAVRPDEYGGRIQVQIEPSFTYPRAIFLAYNDHYDLTRVGRQPISRADTAFIRRDNTERRVDKTATAIEILNETWNDSTRRFYEILERLSELTDLDND